MNKAPSISVIIPVYNESAVISALMQHLEPLRDGCEIIFADGGSSDETVQQIERRGYRAVVSPHKGRASQMNHGASFARGEVLWFLHADSFPPADALAQIREVLGRGYKTGCFRLRFDSRHPFMLLNNWFSNYRVRHRNIAFGDQGIFLWRELFEELGGYAPLPLMEDYRLSMGVQEAGLRFGQTRGTITTSGRRYETHGYIKTWLRMQSLQHRFRRGDDIEEIARMYDAPS